MSLKDYNGLNKEIENIYIKTCIPCMKSSTFKRGDCKTCDIMDNYITLQEKKMRMMGVDG